MITTRYQLLAGEHLEPSPGVDGGVKIRSGEFFESANNWYANRWPEKFRKVDGEESSPFTWNPQLESLEEFTKRAQQLHTVEQAPTIPTPSQDVTASPVDLDLMTVKQLQVEAASAGIDLKGATRKEDILKIIKTALLNVD